MKSQAAIILAAGYSSRMQSFKPLLLLGSQTIIERVIRTYLQQGLDIYLVVGYRQADLRKQLANEPITIVENQDYQTGMFSSVITGMRSLPLSYVSCILTPVDNPLIRPFTIKLLIEASRRYPGQIIYPLYRGQRGHPVVIPMSLKTEILEWKEEGGLKAVLKVHDGLAREIKVPDKYILQDVDTPEDFQQMQDSFKNYQIPDAEECAVILHDICQVSDRVRRHCQKVASVALYIGQTIAGKGQPVDLALLEAASLLHDIAKGQPDHDLVGARMLKEMGFGQIGEIVSSHTNFPSNSSLSLEAKIVYLADKYVREDQLVPLRERFYSSSQRFATNPEIRANIEQREKLALEIQTQLQELTRSKFEEGLL